MAGVLFVFLDGVGLGADDPATNPFAAPWSSLRDLAGARWVAPAWRERVESSLVVRALDASLGVPGLPQSATGQATLLTGRNAAAAMGGHYGPWPGPTLRAMLREGTLFHDGVAAGGSVLANAYPPGYFRALDGGSFRRSATVHAAEAAGLTLASLDAYGRGDAVAADLDGGFTRAVPKVPVATAVSDVAPQAPAGASSRHERRAADARTARLGHESVDEAAVADQARRLARLASRHAFTLFDVWLTDHAGHLADVAIAHGVVARVDAFLGALAACLEPSVTLVVTSDHGNLEDLATRRHTLARVPLVARGPGATAFAGATSLVDVAGAIRTVLRATPPA